MGHAFYRDSHCWAVNDTECNPHRIMPDAYALAPYIGHHLTPGTDDLFDRLINESIPEKVARIETIAQTVTSLTKMKMVAYEGGQHLRHTNPKTGIDQHNPRMADVYRAMLEAYAPHLTHFNHYVHMGGSWGGKQSLGDPERISPKYKTLREWATTHH